MTTPPGGYPAPRPQPAEPSRPYPTPPQQYAAPAQQPAAPPHRYGAAAQRVSRPPRSGRWVPGLLAAFAFLVAAGATVWGSFTSLQHYRDEYSIDGNRRIIEYTTYWWKVDQANARPPGQSTPAYPPYGVLLAVGAGLLMIGAVLAVTAFANRRSGIVTGARVGSALGIGLVTGAVSISLMDGLQALDQANAREAEPGETITFQLGYGIWLPLGAAAVALIGLALALTRAKARVEPDTPRMGFPQPYGYQPYQAAAPQPTPQSAPPPAPWPAHQPAAEPTPQPIHQPATPPEQEPAQTDEQGEQPRN